MAQIIKLKFLGNVYELRAEDDDLDAEAVARYVEQVIASVEEQNSGLPPAKIMVLASMIMGKDCISARKELEAIKSGLSTKGGDLISKIEQTLGEKS